MQWSFWRNHNGDVIVIKHSHIINKMWFTTCSFMYRVVYVTETKKWFKDIIGIETCKRLTRKKHLHGLYRGAYEAVWLLYARQRRWQCQSACNNPMLDNLSTQKYVAVWRDTTPVRIAVCLLGVLDRHRSTSWYKPPSIPTSQPVVMPSAGRPKAAVQPNQDGSVTVQYVPTQSGVHELNFSYNDAPVEGQLQFPLISWPTFVSYLSTHVSGVK